MAYYKNTATIINNSAYTLELDTDESSGIGTGIWPAVISNNGLPVTVAQTGNINMSFSAAYKVQGMGNNSWVVFQFYNAVFIGYHWSMSLQPAGNGDINAVEGTISNNYDDPQSTSEAPLKLSGGGFGGSPATAEKYVICAISYMI